MGASQIQTADSSRRPLVLEEWVGELTHEFVRGNSAGPASAEAAAEHAGQAVCHRAYALMFEAIQAGAMRSTSPMRKTARPWG